MQIPDSPRPLQAAGGGTGAVDERFGLEQPFDRDGLVALRAAVAAHGDRLGVVRDRLTDLQLIAHELASNAIQHGGGRGHLRLWRAGGTAYCRVRDSGGGFAGAAEAGLERPPAGAPSGRGLWLVRQLADEVAIEADSEGTSVTASLRLADGPAC